MIRLASISLFIYIIDTVGFLQWIGYQIGQHIKRFFYFSVVLCARFNISCMEEEEEEEIEEEEDHSFFQRGRRRR